ncbi:hypothetical protein [Candidatus Binatus sp.]|uniref:hypothetical protein n=1 Tax=Candidatus Binatus sp. TaxID=2811406 RepID=UPI003C6B69B8
MDATQQVSSGTPEVSESYKTPEGASERLAELKSNREWVQARLKNGPSSREANEEDALLRIVAGVPLNPATAPVAGAMTAEQAKARLAEFSSDPAKRTRLLDGDLAAKKEWDHLTAIAASGVGSPNDEQPAEPGKPKTAAEARAVLDKVPETPEGYEVDWRTVSPRDPVPEKGVKAISSWAHEIGLTQSEMTTVTHFAGKDVERYQKMSPVEREARAVEVIKDFGKRHGADAAGLYDGACKLAEELGAKDPQFKRFLEQSGIWDSPAVLDAFAVAALQRYGDAS